MKIKATIKYNFPLDFQKTNEESNKKFKKPQTLKLIKFSVRKHTENYVLSLHCGGINGKSLLEGQLNSRY